MEKVKITSIRINESLKQELEIIAARERRSLNNLINIALMDFVKRDKEQISTK